MILNRQKKVGLATRPLAAFLEKIERELKLEGVEVSIAFVSDADIARWNERYLRKKGPTDVLSFPALNRRRGEKSGIPSSRTATFLGDIAIAPETARRYAKKNRRTLHSELRILMLHGVLHLMGYDHENDNGRMTRIEQKLRRRLGIA
jgi:rRNA maturation RNase YbeY